MRDFRHKNIRLAKQNYIGRRLYLVTVCCDGRRPVFRDLNFAARVVDNLREIAEAEKFGIPAYCIMPDHAHLLAEGVDAASDLMAFVAHFKQRTAKEYTQQGDGILWQKKYYDHILRAHENPDAVACYIWLNPVRAGSCSKPQEYPLSGSFTNAARFFQEIQSSWIPSWKKLAGSQKTRPAAT